ncbi:MAG TPA: exopolysaccharide biosynthesis polyisoprenyl-phosphate hexose-1-phosphate transferase EpsZ [Archangium sp.]|uniref:exopolysaccharide biosynthesis polyisoprenyl-phosphate hexose-1-phosphate transferase EpsZ n=1 Tax=Archangium sp. TaxID=1872627 RepID=UPI002E36A024|nr:exopolysaccharide biosynthesis polyisoprenyl-phosphate hexose-1-phosphate transferase EpsZ [Archangium sp.]HEX5750939.1 exopolysaccharide biosynthesis polyisoprenyl-phosphate hexose-1-phosphate transferase EpsZ [Archangium sp.]
MRPASQVDVTTSEPPSTSARAGAETPPNGLAPAETPPPGLGPAETPPPGLALETTEKLSVVSPKRAESLPSRFAPGFAAKLNLAVDVVLVVAALLISTTMMGHDLHLERTDVWVLLGVGVVAWLVVGTALCLYDVRFADRERLDDLALISIQVMVVTVVLFVTRLVMGTESWIVALSLFPPLLWPSVALLRLKLFRNLSGQEQPLDEVLILGVGAMGRLTGEDLNDKHRRKVIGFLSFSNETASTAPPAPLLGTVKDLEHILCTVPVDEVYIAGNMLKHSAEMQAAVKLCEKFGLPFALPAYHMRFDRARPVDDHAISDGYLHFMTHVFRPHQMALKRLFDIVSSAAALAVLSPLLIGVALGVKFTSRGPIFFKQKRVGLHGKTFHMLKFRSMVVNAEELKAKLEAMNEQTGPVFKMKNDPRITRIGRFIRKYSIDELPQLINVLRGEMSVVGPRPPIPSEVEKYAAWQRRRLSVRPGLTCIWQVSGRNQISFEEWMYLDMQYIDHWSLKNDINLILKTVPVVLTGSGAS